MTDTPNPESTVAPNAKPQKPWIELAALYPACFDWKQPRPLKIGIREDLIAAGHDQKMIHRALAKYCARRPYLKATQAGTPRLDLQGRPVGAVTEAEEVVAKAKLAGTWTPPNRPATNTASTGQPALDLPIDASLSEDNIVTGRLELTLKFSDLPKPMPVKNGMKIGIQTDSALVVATLPPKAWKKLEKAQAEWPQWVAALTGKLGTRAGADGAAVVVLENPALQVFEKKAKPTTTQPES
ncbi:ProQ/FINO family protein [Allochromatium vinosum]|uniref:Fertility inhibition FinO-like protein n=1 Tax=Allochromatium vinosum (strain ATCC 17899 / DSM 180 / NBRC 103801 / NCIMB 10441 / D) TaxID=572477 RepID=D3RW54_ALLVD|nr:ProQ/FinO family protein [Allochromatium vinosum]ADC64066.1 Fertility inhibition FinO-like protein [Allochromatium vinosum DSM 180]